MADLTIWISGADFIKMGEFLAEEGRRLFENGGVFGRGRVDFFFFFETHPSYIINSSRITLLIRRAIFAVL